MGFVDVSHLSFDCILGFILGTLAVYLLIVQCEFEITNLV